MTYALSALSLCLLLIIIDSRYFFGTRYWHVPWTHWTLCTTALYLGALTVCDGVSCDEVSCDGLLTALRVASWGCTLSVNAGYWLVLFPMGLRSGKYSFAGLSAASVAKHGGSLLWLFGDALLHGDHAAAFPSLAQSPPAAAAVLLPPALYVLFSAWYHAAHGEYPYGAFFGRTPTRVAFCLAPALLYSCWSSLAPALLGAFALLPVAAGQRGAMCVVLLLLPVANFVARWQRECSCVAKGVPCISPWNCTDWWGLRLTLFRRGGPKPTIKAQPQDPKHVSPRQQPLFTACIVALLSFYTVWYLHWSIDIFGDVRAWQVTILTMFSTPVVISLELFIAAEGPPTRTNPPPPPSTTTSRRSHVACGLSWIVGSWLLRGCCVSVWSLGIMAMQCVVGVLHTTHRGQVLDVLCLLQAIIPVRCVCVCVCV